VEAAKATIKVKKAVKNVNAVGVVKSRPAIARTCFCKVL